MQRSLPLQPPRSSKVLPCKGKVFNLSRAKLLIQNKVKAKVLEERNQFCVTVLSCTKMVVALMQACFQSIF